LGRLAVAIVVQVVDVRRDVQRGASGPARRDFVQRRFGKWISLSQYGFPFSIGRASAPVGRFRALARRARFTWHGRLRCTLLQIAMALAWPAGALWAALQICRNARGRDFGLWQFMDMYWLALRHSIPPFEYEAYQFNRDERRKDMHEYVYSNDVPALVALVERLGADNCDVQNKYRFADICARHDLPHVPTLAVFDRGRQIRPAAPFAPDAPVLWAKGLRVRVGAGGGKWIKDGEAYHDVHGRRVAADKLADELRKQDCLVQPFVENHPEIARVTNGALAALRIVTGIDEHGEAQFITSLIALPHGAWETSICGVQCSIARDTGRIQFAAMLGEGLVTNHPDTGAPIIGIVLPFWHDSVELVRRAHTAAFARFAFLGWDIALTKDGPILLETNSGWGAIFHQMLDGPLGHTAFSRLVGQYV
jgi:hypothetical protein